MWFEIIPKYLYAGLFRKPRACVILEINSKDLYFKLEYPAYNVGNGDTYNGLYEFSRYKSHGQRFTRFRLIKLYTRIDYK
jgi:hypothetical protein